MMLSVRIREDKKINFTFDVSEPNEAEVSYFIREMKISSFPGHEGQFQAYMESVESLATAGERFILAPIDEKHWGVSPKKLIGFNVLAYLEPAIQYQYDEFIAFLSKTGIDCRVDINVEMVLDAIY